MTRKTINIRCKGGKPTIYTSLEEVNKGVIDAEAESIGVPTSEYARMMFVYARARMTPTELADWCGDRK